MRLVAWGPDEKKRAQEIIEFSKAHPYRPGETQTPGEMPEHVMHLLFGVRVVYSITVFPHLPPHRHMSVSVDDPKKLPSPAVVFAIARQLFDFSDVDEKLQIGIPDEEPHVVVLAEPVEELS